MAINKQNKNDQNKMQKNRCFRKPKYPKNNFGEFGLVCKNEGRLELIHINMLRKKVKNFIKKKKHESNITREKIWYFGRPNFFIQKKSKNSRMGKGKGLIERKCIRVRKNFIILEFKGVSPWLIRRLIVFVNKVFSVKMYLLKNYEITYNSLSKNNKYFLYFNKYLVH